MSWKLALATAAVTTAGLTFGLVYLERTAPLPEKPSIRLLVLTGQLPTGDLKTALEDYELAAMAAQERLDLAKAAHDKQAAWNRGARQVYGELQERIAEKQAGQWATARPQQP